MIRQLITHFIKMAIRCLMGSVGMLLLIIYIPICLYSTISTGIPAFTEAALSTIGFFLVLIYISTSSKEKK